MGLLREAEITHTLLLESISKLTSLRVQQEYEEWYGNILTDDELFFVRETINNFNDLAFDIELRMEYLELRIDCLDAPDV